MAFIKRKFNELLFTIYLLTNIEIITTVTTENMSYPELDYFLNESLSDVVFVVDGQRLPALKSILSLKSPVFRDMFSGNLCDAIESEESKLPEIVVKDTTVDAFKTLLRFIYTEVLIFKDDNNWPHIWDVYQLSDRYEVFRLRKQVLTHFESNINVSKVSSIGEFVFTHNIEELIPKVIDFIKKHFKDLVKEDIDGLKSLNQLTNDRLLDEITEEYLVNFHTGYIGNVYGRPTPGLPYFIPLGFATEMALLFCLPISGTTYATIKTLIGLYYFDKLNLKVEEDIQQIREVCRVCDSDDYSRRDLRPVLTVIGKHLKTRLTVENLDLISGIAFDFKIDELIEKVKEMKTQGFNRLDGH